MLNDINQVEHARLTRHAWPANIHILITSHSCQSAPRLYVNDSAHSDTHTSLTHCLHALARRGAIARQLALFMTSHTALSPDYLLSNVLNGTINENKIVVTRDMRYPEHMCEIPIASRRPIVRMCVPALNSLEHNPNIEDDIQLIINHNIGLDH